MVQTEIWQIHDTANVPYAFRNFQKEGFSPTDYTNRFHGETSGSLDEIFVAFNIDALPKGMRSLSVSDIVAFPEKNEVWYVEPIGFRNITKEVYEMAEKII